MDKKLQNIFLLIIILTISFAAIEITIKTLKLADLQSFRQPDKEVHHSLIPNSKGVVRFRDEFKAVYIINSLGMRSDGREEKLEKGKSEFRVVFIGDSFTEGWGLSYEDTFTKLVENKLKAEYPETKWSVFNAGVASYSPITEYAYIKKRIIPLKPDLVVLLLDGSDFHDDYLREQVAVFDENGYPIGFNVQEIPEWKNFFRKYSYTYNFLAKFISLSKGTQRYEAVQADKIGDVRYDVQAMIRSDDAAEKNKERVEKTEFYILNIKKELDKNEIPLLLVTYPNGAQLSKNEWTEGRKQFYLEDKIYSTESFNVMGEFASENKINYLNTYDNFKNAENSGLYPLYYKYDPHWTKNGSMVMADALYESLISNDFYRKNNGQ